MRFEFDGFVTEYNVVDVGDCNFSSVGTGIGVGNERIDVEEFYVYCGCQ